MPRHPSRGRRPYGGDGVDVRAAAQGDQVASRENAEPGRLAAQLIEADVPGDVHPLLGGQQFVVESDETVKGGEHEGASGTGDPLGGSPAHEVIGAGVEVAGVGETVHCEFSGRAGRNKRVRRI
ncbi:hypothetical protein [Streptomyces sp. NPDC001537]